MEPIKVAVIGCGYWGPNLIRNFTEIPSAFLKTVCDLQPQRLEAMKRLYPRLETTQDLDEVMESSVDAVVIATSVTSHYNMAKTALLNDKHVLVEKPLTTCSAEARELVDLAEKRGKVLMVGHTFEYNPAVEVLKNLIQSGQLGKVYYVHTSRLNLGLFQKDINVVWDLAPHDVSILNYILGSRPTGVSAQGSSFVRPHIHDVAYLTLTFPGDVLAHIHISWLDPCKTRRITVVGSDKMVVYDDVQSLEKLMIYDKGVNVFPHTDTFGEFQLSYRYGDINIPYVPFTEPLKLECAHFLDCIREKRTPKSDGRVGLEVVKVLETAQQSLLDGGQMFPINWELPARSRQQS